MDSITKYTFKNRFKRLSNVLDLIEEFMAPAEYVDKQLVIED